MFWSDLPGPVLKLPRRIGKDRRVGAYYLGQQVFCWVLLCDLSDVGHGFSDELQFDYAKWNADQQ